MVDLLIGYINNNIESAWLFSLFTPIFAFSLLLINFFKTFTGDKCKITYSSSISTSIWKSSSSGHSSSSESSSGNSTSGSFEIGGASNSW